MLLYHFVYQLIIVLALSFDMPFCVLAYQDSCKNLTVSEHQITEWFNDNAQTNLWDRPVKDSRNPINVYVQMAMTSFAAIVSCSNNKYIEDNLILLFF